MSKKKQAYNEDGTPMTADEVKDLAPVTQVVVQTINPALAKGKEDNDRIQQLNAEFRAEVSKDPLVKFKPPKFYAQYLGTIYHYTLNNYDVVVRFDGTEQKFPAKIYNHLMKKLARIMDANTSNELEYDEL